METSEKWLSPRAIADMMDVSVDTILQMAHRGELVAVRFGGQIRIARKSLDDYLEQHRVVSVEKGKL